MENDLSFIIDMRLTLYEQQASINPNLPLRFLMYITDIYSAYTRDMNLYGSKPLQLPPPSFVIFYNGTLKQPDRKEYYLSDLFHPSAEPPSLELKAVMLNINKGHNPELMDFSAPNEVIIQKLVSRFHLSEYEARNHLKNYFNKKS